MRNTIAAAALLTLFSTNHALAQALCGDVNETGTVTSSDALAVLKEAVGQPVDLTCDQCGSTCPGDPRYLLGEWVFESDFEGILFENEYDLFAVDEINCEIIGQSLNDGSIVYAYAGEEYDYVLLDPNDTFCDLYVVDYVDPDEVEGLNILVDLDIDGNCDLDAAYDQGFTTGYRLTTATARTVATGSTVSKASYVADRTASADPTTGLTPDQSALIERMRVLYESHRPRKTSGPLR